ncbi:exopolyphosphatase [Fulvivirgaceae bacterium PWU5]|uniref:Exopolyphosphatase n=1 Tax=Dawidia cretensis TaxID=2782350 RepID=A0AAP2DUC0_9BACT|nr:exopolyphosphatase [Dawidia cretensis]MBT1707690.1 exopolyphosphatase [Dawidia cretensis]
MYAKIAIIDMGTNTFHLLMAGADERGYHVLSRDRLAVKIGMGGINEGYITEAGIHRALLAMQSFKNIIEEAGVQKVYAFGTSALRNARNNHEVVARIKALTDLDVDIISGDREAEFIYHGVKSALHLESDRSLIVDIGGGSVEFIIGDNDTIFWKKSLEIGAQRLLEKFHQHDPITPADMQALDVYFDTMLVPLFEALEQYPTRVLVGSSGTFDTLSDIFCIRHDIHKTAEEIETPLSLGGFWEIYDELIHKDRAARMQMPGMIDMRVDMIVVACCLIRYLLERHDFNRIRVSTYSLKEGVLASLIQEMKLLA